MFNITAKGFEKVVAELQGTAKQVRLATALALTRTARMAQDAIYREMQEVFDRPTPYTLRSLFVMRATAEDQKATIMYRAFGAGVEPEKYLNPQVFGGERNRRRFEIAIMATRNAQREGVQNTFIVPTKYAKMDEYGNVQRSQIVQVLSRLRATSDTTQRRTESKRSKKKRQMLDYFIGRSGGRGKRGALAVYQRTGFAIGSSVRPIMFFSSRAKYRKRLPFFEVGQAIIDANIANELNKALDLVKRSDAR